MSDGGHYTNQFLTAHLKASEILQVAFSESAKVTVCFKIFGGTKLLSIRPVLRSLKRIGIYPFVEKEHWSEFEEDWAGEEDYVGYLRHYIAFALPKELLSNALWCALSSDFGSIQPRAQAEVYIFDLHQQIVAFPYDDRGMDIVGPNKALLRELYLRFGRYLLEYDREAMDGEFATAP